MAYKLNFKPIFYLPFKKSVGGTVTASQLRHCELEFNTAPIFLPGLTIPKKKKSNAQLAVKSYNSLMRIKTKIDRHRQTDR